MLVTSIFSFSRIFFLPVTKSHTFILSSASAFNLEQSNILPVGRVIPTKISPDNRSISQYLSNLEWSFSVHTFKDSDESVDTFVQTLQAPSSLSMVQLRIIIKKKKRRRRRRFAKDNLSSLLDLEL